MVATYRGSEMWALPDVGQSFDYSEKAFKAWKEGCQPAREEVSRAKNIGLIMPYGKDVAYFRKEFGNARNSEIGTDLLSVGKYFSKAYDVQSSIREFMVENFSPGSGDNYIASLYHKLKDHAAKKGHKDMFEIKEFGSGYLPKNAAAGILGKSTFLKNKNYSNLLKAWARKYNVSEKAMKIYTMSHEFAHLFGVGGDQEGEKSLESLINDFADGQIKDINSSQGISDKRRTELSKLLREVKRIASERYGEVSENYGNLVSRMKGDYTSLERAVSELAKEAMSKGINTKKGIKEYVGKYIQAEYSKEYEGKKKSNKKKKKEKKQKKQKKKAKKSK